MSSEKEKAVIKALQQDIPLVVEPYRDMAAISGMSEDEFLSIAKGLLAQGFLRKISCALNHRKIGYKYNVMVVWRIPEERVAEVGAMMAASENISHCYERSMHEDFPYNLYTMIHCQSPEEAKLIVETLGKQVGPVNYKLLPTVRELKKTGMLYFLEG